MQRSHKKSSLLKSFIFLPLLFILLLCTINLCVAQEKETWQLFTEINKGQQLLLIDTAGVSKIDDGVTEGAFKCTAKIVPSPKRVKAIRETISQANREAGLEPSKDEQILKGWIDNETKLHECEISCKNDMLYFYIHKQHILEFPVSESGPDRDLFRIVCEQK